MEHGVLGLKQPAHAARHSGPPPPCPARFRSTWHWNASVPWGSSTRPRRACTCSAAMQRSRVFLAPRQCFLAAPQRFIFNQDMYSGRVNGKNRSNRRQACT